MTETKSANTIALARVEDLANRGAEPGWLKQGRLAAWETYLQTPMPTQRDEEWRHTDLTGLDLSLLRTVDYPGPNAAKKSLPKWLYSASEHAGQLSGLLFQQAQGTGYLELAEDLSQKGVIFADLRTVLERHAPLIEPYLTRPATAALDGKFGLMNKALFNCGVVLYVPAGVEIERPFINAISLAPGANTAIFPRVLVIAEANSKVTLLQVMSSDEAGDPAAGVSLSAGLTEVFVGSGAQVSYLECQQYASHVYAINRTHNEVGRDARFTSMTSALGGRQTKQDMATLLEAPGAASEVLGLVLGNGHEHYDFNTIQEHNAPDTTSDINFRVALKDSASSTYQGIIRVGKTAQRTNAYQSNKNLLLGGEARADSIPKLEILADDVKCSHGATVGPVDHEQIFYLMSRGLTTRQAEELVVLGFFRQVLERFPSAGLTEWLAEVVSHKIYENGVGETPHA